MLDFVLDWLDKGQWLRAGQRILRIGMERSRQWSLVLLLTVSLWMAGTSGAIASLNDDHYDGNIFALYAGNGALVPPRINLATALNQDRPTLLVLYIEDSADCKAFSSVVSQLDAYYGRVASFIPINIDSIPSQESYSPTEPGYYYDGFVPKTVLFDSSGEVVLDEIGNVAFERVDDVFREVFDLLPRSESVQLRRRQLNEVNVELVE